MKLRVLFAGFGGQGILLAGRILAQAGLLNNKQVAFIPSYGPEMRGGTANCGVTVSDTGISCPVVSEPDILVAMNRPSQEKFCNWIVPGGLLIRNSSLINIPVTRKDINIVSLPANELAQELGNVRVANIIILGALVKATGIVSYSSLAQSLEKILSRSNTELMALNKQALNLGMQFTPGEHLRQGAPA